MCYDPRVATNGSGITKSDLKSLEMRHSERIEKTETTILKEFHNWAVTFESRFRANEILVGGFNERMIALEARIIALEQGA